MHRIPVSVDRFAARAVLALSLLLSACTSKPPTCSDHFADGTVPVVTSEALAKHTQQLCFAGYAVLHSGISRTPIWSAEHLTASRIEQARQLKRKNAFHAEPKLPAADRAELEDYKGSGYDRGHMAPNGDMATEASQYESFSLANIIPQAPKNNQILWEGIEEATRTLAEQDQQLYVVTGPVFEGNDLERLNGRVLVPTYIYKALYDPVKRQAGAYLTKNAVGMAYQTLSIAELGQRIHINVFPTLAEDIKTHKMALPTPTPHGRRSGKNAPIEVDDLRKEE